MRDIAIDPLRRVRLKLQLLAILAVVFAGIISTVLIVIQQATILPQVISGKDVKVVETLNRKIAHAVSLGIPIEELNGIQEFLEENLRDNEEIRFLSVVTMNGLELAVAGHPPAPKAGPLYEAEISNNRKIYETSGYSVLDVPIFMKNGARIGTTYLSIDKSYIQRLIIKRIIDIITVLGVTTIVALQVLMLLLDRLMLGPLLSLAGWGAAVTGRQSPGAVMPFGFKAFARLLGNVNHSVSGTFVKGAELNVPWKISVRYVKTAFFVMVMGDALCLPILPLFASEITVPTFGLTKPTLLSLYIVTYMMMQTVAGIIGIPLISRLTYRMIFVIGSACSIVSLAYSATAHDVIGFFLSRTLGGFGLGLIFMMSQIAILNFVPRENRTFGIATFTGTFFLATFCGVAMGGVISQQIGFQGTFILGALLVIVSSAIAVTTFGSTRQSPRSPASLGAGGGLQRRKWGPYLRICGNMRFMSLLLCCAVPNRAFNVAILFFLAPLYLASSGATQSEIGRVISIYGLTMAVVAPALAAFIDKGSLHQRSIVSGSIICASGVLGVLLDGEYGVMIVIALMGVGQAMVVPSQMSIVPIVAKNEIAQIGLPAVLMIFRVTERMPAFLAPLGAQWIVTGYGYEAAICTFGAWIAISIVIVYVVMKLNKQAAPVV